MWKVIVKHKPQVLPMDGKKKWITENWNWRKEVLKNSSIIYTYVNVRGSDVVFGKSLQHLCKYGKDSR